MTRKPWATPVRAAGNLATVAIRKSKLRFENVFFSGMAVIILVSVLVGFAPSYYLARVFKAPPVGNLLVQIHGVVFTLWILLLIVQTSLVSADRTDVHRRLGMAGFDLACLVVLLGTLVATENLANNYPSVPSRQESFRAFYAVALSDMLMFSTSIFLSFRNRFNPAAHKRLILIATLAILDVAFDHWKVPMPWWDFRFISSSNG